MREQELRFAAFQRCIKALRNGDIRAVESLLAELRLADTEPRAAALADEIRNRALQKKEPSDDASDSASQFSDHIARIAGADAERSAHGMEGDPIDATPELRARRRPRVREVSPDALLLSDLDKAPPLPGVSLVAGCMNREENLLRVLGSWLATNADEIVIVDWSSTSELWPKLRAIADPRIRVIRIDGEKAWVLTHALNVGLRIASRELVFKVDCDIELAPDFLRSNTPRPGEFVRGFWKAGLEHGGQGQQFINGTFGAYKNDLRKANYYDERILTYGWDDSDLYLRLTHDAGLAGRQIDPRSLRHVEQSESQRFTNQAVSKARFLEHFGPAEFEGAKNKYYTSLAGGWGSHWPPQDYELSRVEERLYTGVRLTDAPRHLADISSLSEVLAIRQLAAWASPEIPQLGTVENIGLDLSSLLRAAHAVDSSASLVDGIRDGRGVHFVRCEPGPCLPALDKTLQLLALHYPAFAESLVIVEAPRDGLSSSGRNVLATTGTLIDDLSRRARAKTVRGISELAERLSASNSEATYLDLSIQSIASEVISKAAHLIGRLEGFAPSGKPIAGTCLVTSLYDEQNLIRLVEYLACVVENFGAFERIAVCYEANNGLLSAVLHAIVDKLDIAPGRLLLLPYQKRPTFEELFSVKRIFPDGTTIVVANADIFFDASLAKIQQVDLSKKVVVLSRRDISKDGSATQLIRLKNGLPNTFSADAWIFRTPFQQDFWLDYHIGSFHCDSFINHQISKSTRYDVVNLCLDIRAFHLHDERFNSSSEKQKRDADQISKAYQLERERNGNVDPIKGVTWSTLSTSAIVPSNAYIQHWRPKGLFLRLGGATLPTFGHLLLIHWLLTDLLPNLTDVSTVISVDRDLLDGTVGKLLARYQAHFLRGDIILDIDDGDFDMEKVAAEKIVHRTMTFGDVAKSLTSDFENIYQFLSWPKLAGTLFLRCDVSGGLSTDEIDGLLDRLRRRNNIWNPFVEFFNALPSHSNERNALTPFVAPLLDVQTERPLAERKAGSAPVVSLITSLSNGGEFLAGYLKNVFAAARRANGEVIIIDANVKDDDALVVEQFLSRVPAARDYFQYVKLDRDPGLYECWRIGIERARSDLISNANVDDRRDPYHTARLVRLLQENTDYAGACGSISCVSTKGAEDWFALSDNEVWFFGEGIREIRFKDLYRLDESGQVKSRNVMHCMPVWRRSLHRAHGYFDEASYGTSADWAFWLKCSKAGEKFVFDERAFGRYFRNPNSHNRRNDPNGVKELRIIADLLGIAQTTLAKQ